MGFRASEFCLNKHASDIIMHEERAWINGTVATALSHAELMQVKVIISWANDMTCSDVSSRPDLALEP